MIYYCSWSVPISCSLKSASKHSQLSLLVSLAYPLSHHQMKWEVVCHVLCAFTTAQIQNLLHLEISILTEASSTNVFVWYLWKLGFDKLFMMAEIFQAFWCCLWKIGEVNHQNNLKRSFQMEQCWTLFLFVLDQFGQRGCMIVASSFALVLYICNAVL